MGKFNFKSAGGNKYLRIAVITAFILGLGGSAVFAYREYQVKNIATSNKEAKSAEDKGDEVSSSLDNNQNQVEQNQASSNTAPKTVEPPKNIAPSQTTRTATPTTSPTAAPVKNIVPVAPKAAAPIAAAPATSTNNGIYSTSAANDYVEGQILVYVNAERRSKGLAPLSFNATLARGADIRVAEESILSFVGTDHTRPNGTSWSTILSQIGYSGYSAAGENLAWGYKPAFTLTKANLDGLALKLFTQWKNSPGHYAQIINPKYNQTGIGVNIIIQNGKLYYFGEELFATR